jgi:hypothetical protein
MQLDFLKTPTIDLSAFYHPLQGLAETLLEYRSAGLSDGRQTLQCPLTRMALLQLRHQETVRQEDQVHVAGLATAIPKLAFTHAQMLLAIPMEAFCACPTIAVYTKDTSHFPSRPVGDQCLSGFSVVTFLPKNDNTNFVIDTRNTNADRKVPLAIFTDLDELAVLGIDLSGQFMDVQFLALEDNLAVELQITDIVACQAVDMVQVVLVGEPTIKGEVAGDVVGNAPVDQVPKENIVITEFEFSFFALILFDEPIEFQGIVLPRSAHVVDDHVIMSNFVALLGVIPEIAGIFNQLAVVVDQDIIDRDDALGTEPGVGLRLQPLNPLEVEPLLIPVAFGNPTVQTRLIRGHSEFTIDGRDVLLVGHHQTGEIFGEVLAFRFIGEQRAKLVQGLLDDGRKIDNRWHRHILHDIFTNGIANICRQITHFDFKFSTLQKSSNNRA